MRRPVLLLAVVVGPLIAAAMLLVGGGKPTATVEGDGGNNRLTGTPGPDAMYGFDAGTPCSGTVAATR